MLYMIPAVILAVFCAVLIVKYSQNRSLMVFFILIFAAMICGLVSGIRPADLANILKRGFAETIAGTGLVIITGHLYAMLLYKSGAIDSLARLISMQGKTGKSSLALAVTGGVVSIPAQCEAGYAVFSPLGRAVSVETGISPAVTAFSLACGMYITNLLVVPTAGPLTSAGIMNANILLLFILGLAVSIPGIIGADYFCRKYAAGYMPDSFSESAVPCDPVMRPLKTGTALLFSLLPVIFMLLKGAATLSGYTAGNGPLWSIICFTGEPFIAIIISAGMIVLFIKKKKIIIDLPDIAGESLKRSAGIMLVTAAAGAFASMFRITVVMEFVPNSFPHWAGLLVPFCVASFMKLLQGNSTLAMISASSITFASVYSMRLCPELAVLAAGAGAMTVSHSNDPFFWIVLRFSGMPAREGFRVFTVATLVCGAVTFAAVIVLGLFI